MVARWWGVIAFPPHVSTGNRTRATIKALPSPLHHPRPYGKGISPVRMERRNIHGLRAEQAPPLRGF